MDGHHCSCSLGKNDQELPSWVMARGKTYCWPKSVILWPYKYLSWVRPVELSWGTAAVPALPSGGTLLRAHKSSPLWYSKDCSWWQSSHTPLHTAWGVTLACWEMQRDLVWAFHWCWVEFFMGTFRHRELGVYIVYLCVSELIMVWMLLPQIYC